MTGLAVCDEPEAEMLAAIKAAWLVTTSKSLAPMESTQIVVRPQRAPEGSSAAPIRARALRADWRARPLQTSLEGTSRDAALSMESWLGENRGALRGVIAPARLDVSSRGVLLVASKHFSEAARASGEVGEGPFLDDASALEYDDAVHRSKRVEAVRDDE